MRVVLSTLEESKLIDNYKKDFHDKTGKYIKLVNSSKEDSDVSLVEQVPFLKICQIIMDLNKWNWTSVYTKRRWPEDILRRGLIDFIAINNGNTYTQIGEFTDRDHSTIIHSVREFREKMIREKEYELLLLQTIQYIKENLQYYNKPILLADLMVA